MAKIRIDVKGDRRRARVLRPAPLRSPRLRPQVAAGPAYAGPEVATMACLRKDGPCSGPEMVALWRSASGLVIQQGPICEAHRKKTPGLDGAVLIPERVSDEEAERLVSFGKH